MCVLPDADSGCLAATRHAAQDRGVARRRRRQARDTRRLSLRTGDRGSERRVRRYRQSCGAHGRPRQGHADHHHAGDGREALAGAAGVDPQNRRAVGQGQGRRHRGLRSDLAGRRGPHDDDAVDRRRRGAHRASSDARRAEARAGAGELDRLAGPRRRAARSFSPIAKHRACTPASSAAATSSSWSIRAPTAPSSRSREKRKSPCGARR